MQPHMKQHRRLYSVSGIAALVFILLSELLYLWTVTRS